MISISPHTHVESYLTGSSIENMILRAKSLGRKYFSYTDDNHLSSALKTYKLVKSAELKPILGIEIYFKDPKCEIVGGTEADRCKYFTATIFAKTQVAFQELCRVVSKTDLPKILVHGEEQSLWSWEEISRLAKFETMFILGGPHDICGKTLLASNKELAEKVFFKLYKLFGDRLSVALICEPWSKKFAHIIKVTYTDLTHDALLATDTVSTDRARKIKAGDLLTRSGHNVIESKICGQTYFKIDKKIEKVEEIKGFLPLSLDVTLQINKFLLEMSKKYRVMALVSDYAFYAEKSDHIVQDLVLENKTKLKANLHMKTEEEFYSYLYNFMDLNQEESVKIVGNNDIWAKNFDNFELKYEWRLADGGENPLNKCMDIIKAKGLMRWQDPIWTARLREEILVLSKNGIMDLSPYFLPIHDVINYYEENGCLTGPGRGSSAGSLVSYLMGITKVNPFLYNLSFNRFYSIDRIKANKPSDIDSDLESRDLLVGEDGKSGYLFGRWGDKTAQISTRGKTRLKSSIKDVNRYIHGAVQEEINQLCKKIPDAGQGITDDQFLFGFEDEDENHIDGLIETSEVLRKYAEERPNEWDLVKKSLNLTKSFGRHACAYIIADKPISDFIPTKYGYVTQYEAGACEEAKLIKYDFLVINQLKDIRVCLDLINKKNSEKNKVGNFTHNGKNTHIWDLPKDPEVFKSVWDGATDACFQISTPGMTSFIKQIMPKSMEDLSIVVSLYRPGPLDYIIEESGRSMAFEYVHRRNGDTYTDIPVLNDLIPETYSVLVYQEQVTKIAKELAGFNGSAAENLREVIGKKKRSAILKIKPDFINGCLKSDKVTEDEAQQLWERIVTFGRYAFNKSHGISYSYITYACMFLKHHYNLEFWAAILSNATQKEISDKLWPHVKDLLASPDINLSSEKMEIDYANSKIRSKIGIIRGMGDKSINPIVENRPYTSIQDFVNKDVAGPSLSRKLIHVGVLDSLFPPKLELLQKLQLFEDAVEIKKYNEKVEKAKLEGKTIKTTEPKTGVIPEYYTDLCKDVVKNALKNAAIQKSILPSLLVGLNDLGKNHSRCIVGRTKPSKMMTSPKEGREVLLITGEMLARLDEMKAESVLKDVYIAVTAYIVESKIFDYKKNTKQALKVIIDCDSFLSEKVLWPDYFSGELEFPPELTKGNICTVFLKKRANKGDPCSIQEIVIEA